MNDKKDRIVKAMPYLFWPLFVVLSIVGMIGASTKIMILVYIPSIIIISVSMIVLVWIFYESISQAIRIFRGEDK